jgi:flavin reductase (DIM6/NTAB) family NADH-FMN oxidoreductase RutF
MTVDPASTTYQNIEKLMVSVILPRPIAWVSTISAEGVVNLAPFSYFTAVCPKPPVICFSPVIRFSDGAKKDTLRNIEATGEFVVNVVSEEVATQMVHCAGEYPPDVSEFTVAGLTPIPSDLVKPPRVKESHVHMECRLLQIVTVSDEPGGGSLVMGTVLRFHVDDGVLTEGRVDPGKLRAIGRMGGQEYTRTMDRFPLTRPKV